MEKEKERLITNVNFLKLLSTDLFSKFADSMDNIIVTLLVIELTGSSKSTGIMLAITTIPGILFSLVGGTLSDMKSQKRIMSLMTLSQSVLLLLLISLIKMEKVTFVTLCIILFVLESFSRVYSPSLSSATLAIVSKEHYKEAISVLNTTGSLIQMVGSSISAIVVSFIGYIPALFLNSVSYLSSSFISTKLKINREPQNGNSNNDIYLKIKSGLSYILNHVTILNLILIVSIINFILAWFDVALPFLLTDYLKVPIEFIGYMKSTTTLMFVLAGVLMSKFKIENTDKVIGLSIFMLGILIYAITLNSQFLFVVILWGMAAFFRTIASLLLMSQLGVQSDEDKIGRVMGFFMFVTSITMLISRLLSGYLVSYFGAKITFRIAGIIIVGLSLLTILKLRKKEGV